ncbi:unnamed protein product, partial [Didymodactylos carnosus]
KISNSIHVISINKVDKHSSYLTFKMSSNQSSDVTHDRTAKTEDSTKADTSNADETHNASATARDGSNAGTTVSDASGTLSHSGPTTSNDNGERKF